MKPLIGISSTPNEVTFDHGHFRRYALSNTYTGAVVAAGGIPVILSEHIETIDGTLDRLDGIIFSGGGDIDPSFWNEERHPAANGFDAERDAYELEAIRKVVARDMPMLGICRGIQAINVALGGSLYQDIADQLPNSLQHRQHELGLMNEDQSHDITIVAGENPLYRTHNADTMTVNSFHHQALRDVADDLKVIATAPDGIVEAAWLPQMRFGLALQWHPEMLAAKHPEHAAIFDTFVRAVINDRVTT